MNIFYFMSFNPILLLKVFDFGHQGASCVSAYIFPSPASVHAASLRSPHFRYWRMVFRNQQIWELAVFIAIKVSLLLDSFSGQNQKTYACVPMHAYLCIYVYFCICINVKIHKFISISLTLIQHNRVLAPFLFVISSPDSRKLGTHY